MPDVFDLATPYSVGDQVSYEGRDWVAHEDSLAVFGGYWQVRLIGSWSGGELPFPPRPQVPAVTATYYAVYSPTAVLEDESAKQWAGRRSADVAVDVTNRQNGDLTAGVVYAENENDDPPGLASGVRLPDPDSANFTRPIAGVIPSLSSPGRFRWKLASWFVTQPSRLTKVGFTPRQAAVLQGVAAASIADLVRAGFTARQAKLLKSSPTFRDLLVQGKFTRKQSALLLDLT